MAYIQGFVISLNVYNATSHHSSKIYKSFITKFLIVNLAHINMLFPVRIFAYNDIPKIPSNTVRYNSMSNLMNKITYLVITFERNNFYMVIKNVKMGLLKNAKIIKK